MTTSITVRVNGNYVREVTGIGESPIKVGPGSNIERTFEHGECAAKDVTIRAERAATAEEIEAAKPKPPDGNQESPNQPT
jgi:hypothetical protein